MPAFYQIFLYVIAYNNFAKYSVCGTVLLKNQSKKTYDVQLSKPRYSDILRLIPVVLSIQGLLLFV